VSGRQREQLAKAVEDVRAERKKPTSARIVAALTFSFWTSLVGADYENLWQTTLYRIGVKPDGKGLRRKDFSGPLTPIRTLRNRIAPHEPIIMWDLCRADRVAVASGCGLVQRTRPIREGLSGRAHSARQFPRHQ
jgi:hypothetical protein